MTKPLDELPLDKVMQLEQLTIQLLDALKRTGLKNSAVFGELVQLEEALGRVRRAQFDAANPTFHP